MQEQRPRACERRSQEPHSKRFTDAQVCMFTVGALAPGALLEKASQAAAVIARLGGREPS
jgi:hypothetical protein